jgi:DNA polymerase I
MKPLPNIRKLFLPDKGQVICDVDLQGADAQVVAWEAADQDLKKAFADGIDIHNHNGRAMYGDLYDPKKPGKIKPTVRDELKSGVHGTNYGASARTLAITFGWTIREAEAFQDRWFRLHPGIKEQHRRVEHDVQLTRTVYNKFGNRIIYFDRPANLLPKALAWIPQSTVAGITGRAGLALRHSFPWLTLLLQVHDSLIFQVPTHRFTKASFSEIQHALSIPVPYPDPLIIPWGLAASWSNWGEVRKYKWEELQ